MCFSARKPKFHFASFSFRMLHAVPQWIGLSVCMNQKTHHLSETAGLATTFGDYLSLDFI